MVVEAAMAAAARSAGYPAFADLIADDHLSPQAAAFVFRRFSVASDKGRTLALVLAAAAIARFRMDPAVGWDREAEEQIIRQALSEPRVLLRGKLGAYNHDTARALQKVTAEAAKLVAGLWS
jgi:hypothetical protein